MPLTLSKLAGLIDAKMVRPEGGPHLESKVEAIRYRSQDVQEGDIFCAVPGTKVDGHDFAVDACERGALAVICLHEIPGITCMQLVVADVRKAMADAARYVESSPAGDLSVIGITGTNGKTTVSQLVAYIALACGRRSGTIGTLGADLMSMHIDTEHTTPEAPVFQGLLAQARDAEIEVLACEVSSHALDLDRTWGTAFDVVAFTNLTQDHLDYHDSMESYFRAKARLFMEYDVEHRVICTDDDRGRHLAALCGEWNLQMTTVGHDRTADLCIMDEIHEPHGTSFTLIKSEGGSVGIRTPFVGGFNVNNAALAFGICRKIGLEEQAIVDALAEAPQVPGRLELVEKDAPVRVYVDYAHTPDALEKAITAVSETKPDRLITVFGCGGDRDRKKRPLMGAVAARSDIAVVTSDNPRTEDPDAIVDDIMVGILPEATHTGVLVHREVDRETAIRLAIDMAKPGDAVLIAGKGHEDYQIVGTEKHHLDDREISRDALSKRADVDA